MTEQVNRGRATSAEREALLGAHHRRAPTTARLSDCDLVIEAVFEDRKVKAETIKKAQAVIGDKTIFASNTSTLPITSLADEFKDPARFIGIHFFSPVERMMLVEIILGKKTGDVALATALDFVRAIRKTPIVVNDSRGFFANRCVLNYIQEGHLMFMEGVPAAMIENVGRMAGMPVGPLSLNDEVALDLGWKILKATEADLGPKAVNAEQKWLLQELVEKRGRLGRKNGKGFYDYPPSGPKRLWPGLAELQKKKLDPDKIDIQELKYRLLVVQSLEAARCVEEGVITDVREADVGSILGFGFAPFTGGTLSYIDMMGTKRFVDICKKLEKKYGAALQAAEAPGRHGAEGRHLLRPLRAGRRPGGVASVQRDIRDHRQVVGGAPRAAIDKAALEDMRRPAEDAVEAQHRAPRRKRRVPRASRQLVLERVAQRARPEPVVEVAEHHRRQVVSGGRSRPAAWPGCGARRGSARNGWRPRGSCRCRNALRSRWRGAARGRHG